MKIHKIKGYCSECGSTDVEVEVAVEVTVSSADSARTRDYLLEAAYDEVVNEGHASAGSSAGSDQRLYVTVRQLAQTRVLGGLGVNAGWAPDKAAEQRVRRRLNDAGWQGYGLGVRLIGWAPCR